MSRPWDAEAQAAGEAALEALYNSDGDNHCVCETCIVREVLTAAWDLLRTGVLEEAAKLGVDPAKVDAAWVTPHRLRGL